MYAKRIVLAVAAGGAAVALAAGPSASARTGDVDIPRHQHFLISPDGEWHEVGPRVCDDPGVQNAFNEFHGNVHFGQPFDVFAHDHNKVGTAVVRPCP